MSALLSVGTAVIVTCLPAPPGIPFDPGCSADWKGAICKQVKLEKARLQRPTFEYGEVVAYRIAPQGKACGEADRDVQLNLVNADK